VLVPAARIGSERQKASVVIRAILAAMLGGSTLCIGENGSAL
jgi:hypothetical protein